MNLRHGMISSGHSLMMNTLAGVITHKNFLKIFLGVESDSMPYFAVPHSCPEGSSGSFKSR